MKCLLLFTFLITLLCLCTITYSEVVCSEDELVKEIIEDLDDNGKLDCLKDTPAPEGGETEDQKIKRLRANWDGDCSFESINENHPWTDRLFALYPMMRGMIDVNGNTIEKKNFENQADMCEIVRTMIGNNMIKGITLVGDMITSINKNVAYEITCPGELQSKICAATGGSFADPYGWYIFLDGQSISINGKPKYTVSAGAE